MTDDDRFVFIHEPLDPDECHLVQCKNKDRRIRLLAAVVSYMGVDVIMHPECARRFKWEVNLEQQQKLSRINYAWN